MATPKTNTPATPKKGINWETVKTVTIAVLITGIVAFIAGAYTMSHYQGDVLSAAKAMTPSAAAQAPAAEAPASK